MPGNCFYNSAGMGGACKKKKKQMKRVETRVIKKDGNMKVKGFGAFVFIDHYRAAVCYCAVLTGFEGYLLVVARLLRASAPSALIRTHCPCYLHSNVFVSLYVLNYLQP